MIKVICIKNCKSFFGDDNFYELIPYKLYYIKEENYKDYGNPCELYGIYDKIFHYKYIGLYESNNFITLQEWRQQRINKILDE